MAFHLTHAEDIVDFEQSLESALESEPLMSEDCLSISAKAMGTILGKMQISFLVQGI